MAFTTQRVRNDIRVHAHTGIYDGGLIRQSALLNDSGDVLGSSDLPHALLSATHSDSVANAVSRGSLIYGNSTPAWDDLLVGSANAFLGSDGTDPAWTAAGALTKTDDTNITLTLGGTPTTALLRAASLTLGWAGTLSMARGGAGRVLTAANGGMVYSDADSLEILAATATAGQILRSGSNVAPSWSTATYPATAGTSGNVLTSDGTNWSSATVASLLDDDLEEIAALTRTRGDLIVGGASAWVDLAIGTANQVLGVHATLADPEYKSILGTAAEITIAHAAGSITASLPTALTFTGKTVTNGTFVTPTISATGWANANHTHAGSTTGGTIAASAIASGAALTRVDDTNLTLTLGGSPTTALLAASSLTLGWTGTLAAARLNSSVVQSVVNDTNVTGSISAQALTLGWTSTLAVTRGGTGNATGTATINANLTGHVTSVGNAAVLGSFTSLQLLTALTDETGTGANVFATSPTLVTPLLGTPTSGVLTNTTGLPIATGVSGLAAGVATFLATPSSANLIAALTDETGTGASVFATSPTLVTPLLGTPTSGVLTNCTGLPVASGISGLGSNVATWLATPSSANLAAAVTGETGSGALVFATSPTFVTPILGVATATSLTIPKQDLSDAQTYSGLSNKGILQYYQAQNFPTADQYRRIFDIVATDDGGGTAGSYMRFLTGPGTGTLAARIIIDPSGNVGIGAIPDTAAALYVTGNLRLGAGMRMGYKQATNADGNYTILQTDYFIDCNYSSGTHTVTLPSATTSGAGKVHIIHDISGGAGTAGREITIASSSGLIESSTTKIIATNFECYRLYSDGTNWWKW